MKTSPPIRVLIAKPGLDGHDKGAKIVCQMLRDAGMEVLYSGLHAAVGAIVKCAVEEDVNVVGLSIHSGAHKELCKKIVSELRRAGYEGGVVLGGVVPASDEEILREMGIEAIFRMDTPEGKIIEAIQSVGSKACRKKS